MQPGVAGPAEELHAGTVCGAPLVQHFLAVGAGETGLVVSAGAAGHPLGRVDLAGAPAYSEADVLKQFFFGRGTLWYSTGTVQVHVDYRQIIDTTVHTVKQLLR